MLNLFLSGRGRAVFLLPVLVLIFGITSFVNRELYVDSPSFLFGWMDSLMSGSPLIKLLIGLFFITAMSLYSNLVFNSNGFHRNETSLPALFMVILIAAWKGFHLFSPLMLAILFFMLGINRILKVYHQKNILSESFDSGFYLGLAAVIYYPMAFFLISFYFYLSFNRAFSFREYFFNLLGLSIPFFFLSVGFFFFDHPFDFLHWQEGDKVASMINFGSLSQRIFIVLSCLSYVLALPYFISQNNRAKVQTKNAGRFILVLMINSLFIYWVSFRLYPIHNRELLLVLPLIFTMPFFFLHANKLLRDLLFYFWIIAAFFFNIFPSV